MKKALYFEPLKDNEVRCDLCPHTCIIKPDNKGICGVRVNDNGELYSQVYNKVSAINIDPVEKKPLYHYFPGEKIVSVGTIGCNLKCKFCQNWDISQPESGMIRKLYNSSPESITSLAIKENIFGIAYTYNEPTVWYEWMLDIAKLSQDNNLKNVVVSNGYINKKPLAGLLKFIDAFNIDLKAFDDGFYRKYASAGLEPVKSSLEQIKNSGRHLEITNLVIPGLNDDQDVFFRMIKWISENLGKETVLHLSRYFPTFKLDIESTPPATLITLYDIARSELHHVYLGNIDISKGKNTFCSSCGNLLIKRSGYLTDLCGIDEYGKCLRCENIDIINN